MGRLCGAVLPIQFTINNNIALYTQKLADNNNLDRIIVNFAVILYKRSIQYGHAVEQNQHQMWTIKIFVIYVILTSVGR